MAEVLSVDSAAVVGQVANAKRRKHAQSKGLANHVACGRSATFSGFDGWLRRAETYLLIPRPLLAKLGKRRGEGLFNLKDFLTAFPWDLRAYLKTSLFGGVRLAAKTYQI